MSQRQDSAKMFFVAAWGFCSDSSRDTNPCRMLVAARTGTGARHLGTKAASFRFPPCIRNFSAGKCGVTFGVFIYAPRGQHKLQVTSMLLMCINLIWHTVTYFVGNLRSSFLCLQAPPEDDNVCSLREIRKSYSIIRTICVYFPLIQLIWISSFKKISSIELNIYRCCVGHLFGGKILNVSTTSPAHDSNQLVTSPSPVEL